MALLEKAVDIQVEECLYVQMWIPPLIKDGRKLKFSTRDMQGNFPPIPFLIPDGDELIKAKFYPIGMRWEIVEDE